ncbi:ornithine carbamoyltransferase [Novosphingobium marinum]|uniref:Ornithine carbamoyltransferase n=2 Tax=Novosphingobium marinum TaxID=1514948 RepID=A0A7Y9XUG1_9SPHN|nr:ornithine carbamoyltransferase [Novosphingobium marinum]GGC38215.1 ornithine carbamoyltransferase [Novosphingobium marinum]
MRHFLNLSDAGGDAIAAMLNDAIDRKAARANLPKGVPDPDAPLAGRVLAMIFEKNSTRTRVSFDMAMRQLGGTSIVMESAGMQLGRGETVADTAQVLGRMVDAIMIRTDDHAKIEELADRAGVPVINGLTDHSHPCQIVADLLTLVERGISLPGLQMAWLGDGNNVAHSMIEAAGLMKFRLRLAVPPGYEPEGEVVERARANGGEVTVLHDPVEAATDASVIVTDCWVSMGQSGAEERMKALAPYQVNAELMGKARADAVFMHCLPAHRGEEVTADVIDGPQSAVWDEAENRLHAQKSVLRWVLGQL